MLIHDIYIKLLKTPKTRISSFSINSDILRDLKKKQLTTATLPVKTYNAANGRREK